MREQTIFGEMRANGGLTGILIIALTASARNQMAMSAG
jgi:hypothetical protein